MEYIAIHNGKEITYNGYIESLGQYPSDKANGYTVWFGQTDNGFLYDIYLDIDKPQTHTVYFDFKFANVFRFAKGFKTLKDGIENAGITLSKELPIPHTIHEQLILSANELKKENRKIDWSFSDAEDLISQLKSPEPDSDIFRI